MRKVSSPRAVQVDPNLMPPSSRRDDWWQRTPKRIVLSTATFLEFVGGVISMAVFFVGLIWGLAAIFSMAWGL